MSIEGSRGEAPAAGGTGAYTPLGALATLHTAYVCSVCGYGVAVAGSLPTCPMCGGDAWQPDPSGLRGAARRESFA